MKALRGCSAIAIFLAAGAALAADGAPLAQAERLFLEFLDARDASAYLETGHVEEWDGASQANGASLERLA